MKPLIFVPALYMALALCCGGARADIAYVTGAQLYEQYKVWRDVMSSGPPVRDTTKAALYVAYVAGSVDSMNGIVFCGPNTVSVNDLAGVVGKYLESHPRDLHRSGSAVAGLALREAYPCSIKR